MRLLHVFFSSNLVKKPRGRVVFIYFYMWNWSVGKSSNLPKGDTVVFLQCLTFTCVLGRTANMLFWILAISCLYYVNLFRYSIQFWVILLTRSSFVSFVLYRTLNALKPMYPGLDVKEVTWLNFLFFTRCFWNSCRIWLSLLVFEGTLSLSLSSKDSFMPFYSSCSGILVCEFASKRTSKKRNT